ncbi:MAG: hypothetical protein IJ788_07655 [Oscillospiraceae bacterium]|nr:hypothetical protein [Oscillospiraceae bacterium]
MVYLWIALAILALGEVLIGFRLSRLEESDEESVSEEKLERFSEAVAEILSYDLERAKEAMKNE